MEQRRKNGGGRSGTAFIDDGGLAVSFYAVRRA